MRNATSSTEVNQDEACRTSKGAGALPLLRPLQSSGSLRSVLEAAVAAAPLPAPSAAGSAAGRQPKGKRQHDEDAGWKCVHHSKKTKEEASQKCSPQREGYRNLCAGARPERLYAEPAALPVSAGRHSVMYQSTAPQGSKTKERSKLFLNLCKQHTEGWEASDLAPRVAARRWVHQHWCGGARRCGTHSDRTKTLSGSVRGSSATCRELQRQSAWQSVQRVSA